MRIDGLLPVLVGLVLLGGSAAAGTPAVAQELRLAAVDSLAADGRVDEARDRLTAWWEARWDGADRRQRQRALWLRGKLTVDPTQARSDYQRLALEYPGGTHSADALLRLGQEAAARGRPLEAGRRFEGLVRDYPNHPGRLEARRWLDDNAEVLERARREAARAPPDGGTPAPSVPGEEVDGQADPPEAPEPGPDAPDPPPARSDAVASGPVSVQLGAFSTRERAEDLAGRARDQGFRVRLVRIAGSGLVRVRVGRFPDRRAAHTLLQRIRDRGLDATLVTDARKETPIR